MTETAGRGARGSDLTNRLLASVSRSFYLSLRVLPRGMKGPVSLGYLLARLTDTVADSSDVAADRRLRWLHRIGVALQSESESCADEDWSGLAGEVIPGIEHPGERELIQRAPECLAAFAALPSQDHKEVAWVMNHILRGQAWDVEWFEIGRQPDEPPVRCARDAGAVHDYTFAVAGSVGRFWTRMCEQHCPCWRDPGVSRGQMEQDGEQLGRGLQWINILRDAPKDLKLGRCYLPIADRLAAPSGSAVTPAERVAALHAASGPWLDVCQDKLEAGARYVSVVRNRRLRLATALPWILAEHTLDRVRKADTDAWQRGVKLTRGEVKSLLRRTGFRVLLGSSLAPLRPAGVVRE